MMQEVMSGQNLEVPGYCYDVPRVLQMVESLGDNCDLGIVQRAVGLEPFGLFRFAACDAPGVNALLKARFLPLGEPEDLWLDVVGPRRELWVKSRHFSFEAYVNRDGAAKDMEVTRLAQIERIRFLRTHLIRDLSRGRRLFVFKGQAELATIEDMAAQLQDYGPNCLLWITTADTAHEAGQVDRVSSGLLHGYVSRFGTYEGDPSLPVEEWIAVCVNAYRLWRGSDVPKVPLDNLISRAVAARLCQWFGEPSAATHAISAPAFPSDLAFEHTLATTKTTPVYHAHFPISSGGNLVFSAWVKIPKRFRGLQVAALLSGFPSLAMWTADVTSRARWQRVWVAANVPTDAYSISCELMAEGAVGDSFRSAAWCLERGNRPTGYGFSL